MSPIHPSVAEARELVARNDRASALAVLDQALLSEPENSAILVEKGLILCYIQREDEALECLQAASPSQECAHLVSILAQYGHARMDLARKLGIDDQSGLALWTRVQPYIAQNQVFVSSKLSAVLITKNESSNLLRCLESLKGKVDEIVVVDTGSTDDTVTIAESFGAVTGFFEWVDDFAAARNASLELATGDWALWIDADEVVDEASWPSIWEAIIRPQFGGYFIPIVNFTDEDENSQYTHAPIRLFRHHPEIRFENKIHEQISPSIDRLGLATATLEKATIWHYGYKPAEMESKQKIERTISMLEKQVEEEPNDAFHWFNLANAYSVARRYEESGAAARKCLDRLDPGNVYGSLVFQLLQSAFNATNRAEEAFDAFLECKQAGFFTILNQFELAHSLLLLGKLEDANTAIDACMTMDWPLGMTGDKGIVTHKSATLKAQILTELGRNDDALQFIDESLAVDPNFGLSIFTKGIILERLGQLDEALTWLTNSLNHPSVAFDALKALARVSFVKNDFVKAREYGAGALEANPHDKEAWIWWAKAIEETGTPDERIDAYANFHVVHGSHADVLTNWGRALGEKGDFEAAADKFNSAVDKDPTCTNAWLNFGDLFYKCGLFQDAVAAYDAALRIDATNAEAWFCLGNSAGQLGAWDAAQAAYAQALTIDPEHEKAAHNLSVAKEELQAA